MISSRLILCCGLWTAELLIPCFGLLTKSTRWCPDNSSREAGNCLRCFSNMSRMSIREDDTGLPVRSSISSDLLVSRCSTNSPAPSSPILFDFSNRCVSVLFVLMPLASPIAPSSPIKLFPSSSRLRLPEVSRTRPRAIAPASPTELDPNAKIWIGIDGSASASTSTPASPISLLLLRSRCNSCFREGNKRAITAAASSPNWFDAKFSLVKFRNVAKELVSCQAPSSPTPLLLIFKSVRPRGRPTAPIALVPKKPILHPLMPSSLRSTVPTRAATRVLVPLGPIRASFSFRHLRNGSDGRTEASEPARSAPFLLLPLRSSVDRFSRDDTAFAIPFRPSLPISFPKDRQTN
mmetsp:Transcript_35220/g.77106  ORF Transcript_35220/g.77106 Transcript_35220/m.77106 type:complete len:350 (+) Transcript_35220:1019-2068(+)